MTCLELSIKIWLQTDDTLNVGTSQFKLLEDKKIQMFKHKNTGVLTLILSNLQRSSNNTKWTLSTEGNFVGQKTVNRW